jgi:hypothetical protein
LREIDCFLLREIELFLYQNPCFYIKNVWFLYEKRLSSHQNP